MLLAGLVACGFDVPLKEPVPVVQQAQRSAGIRPGESTREGVRAALGQPVLHSRFWGFELFQASGTSTELGGVFVTVWPVPMGVFTAQVEGFTLVAYDTAGRVTDLSAGRYASDRGSVYFEMLKADEVYMGLERVDTPHPALMVDAHRLQDYLALRRTSGTCTVVIACEESGPADSPYGACPDRIAIDGKAFNPRPFAGFCEPGKSCPAGTAIERKDLRRVPVVLPITLQPGHHQMVMSRLLLQGHPDAGFDCSAGDVRYGVIRAHESRTSTGRRSTTLEATVSFESTLPARWRSHSVLLHRQGGWVVEQEPEQP